MNLVLERALNQRNDITTFFFFLHMNRHRAKNINEKAKYLDGYNLIALH